MHTQRAASVRVVCELPETDGPFCCGSTLFLYGLPLENCLPKITKMTYVCESKELDPFKAGQQGRLLKLKCRFVCTGPAYVQQAKVPPPSPPRPIGASITRMCFPWRGNLGKTSVFLFRELITGLSDVACHVYTLSDTMRD
jgi:hypothetical protein